MKAYQYLTMGLSLLLLPMATVFAAESAQDAEISVSPAVHQFPVTTLGTSSTPALFTISNLSSGSLSLGTIELAGVNADEFELGTNNCPASLSAGSGCTVAVSFRPLSKGTKSAYLSIPSGAAATPVLTAFLTNGSSAVVAAQQRIPAVLASVSIPDSMAAGSTQTLIWTLEGYHDNSSSYAVMFDCTGVAEGTCGDSYDDPSKFAESTVVTPTEITPGNWKFNGVSTKLFTYNWNFTVPATRTGGAPWATSPGSDIVVRFYWNSDIDTSRNSESVSLLIPGNQASSYYDTAGRRIVKKIVAP